MSDYLNPRVFGYASESHKWVMSSSSHEVCAEGPARTSKTVRNLRKLLALHFQFSGFMSAVVRTNSVDLTDSVKYDLRSLLLKYDLEDPRSPIRQRGGPTNFDTLILNGGEMRFGGMNRPGRILGTQYDAIMLSELSQFSEEQYQILKTRCSGSSGIWRKRNGEVMFQMICDTNPDAPSHWMYSREEQGLLGFRMFGFHDNPAFYRYGRWSKVGLTTVNELDRSLTGIYHDRYFSGLRVAPEGSVFTLRPCHFIDYLPDGMHRYRWYNAMDFGMSSPSVCLYLGQHVESGDVIVYKDYRHMHQDIIEFGTVVRSLRKYFGTRILGTIIDNDENRQQLLLKQLGLPTELARKGPGSIKDGIFLMQAALKNAENGVPGGLYFMKDLREDVPQDREIVRRPGPKDVIEEMRAYHFIPEEKQSGSEHHDLPVAKHDHGVDALRYFFLWDAERHAALGFGSGKVNSGPVGFLV